MSNVTTVWNVRLLLKTPIQCRHYNVTSPPCKGNLADVVFRSQPTLKTDEGVLRVRKHGNKEIPLPPLLDFEDGPRVAQKSKCKNVPQPENSSKFQRDLANNPFAQALATPVRQCNLTQTRLPTHFLLPTTTTISQTTTQPDKAPRITANLRLGRRARSSSEEALNTHSYVLNRQAAVEHISKKSRWQFLVSERQRKLVGKLTQRNWQAWKFVKDYWTWDEKEVENVREMYELEVVEAVRDALNDVEDHGEADAGETESVFSIRVGAPESQTEVEMAGERLDSVLSDDHVRVLVGAYPALSNRAVGLRSGTRTMKLRLALDRLHRFRATITI